MWPLGDQIKYPKIQFEKGIKFYQKSSKFFAEYLKKKNDEEEKAKKKAGFRKKAKIDASEDEEMKGSSDESEKEIDEEKEVPADAIKRLEASFMNIKDSQRKFELKPNLINADYCMKRLLKGVNDPKDFRSDLVYG